MAYSWITPKTNWASGDFCTYVDINRILNNILYLYDEIGVIPLYPALTPTVTLVFAMYAERYNQIQEEVFHLYGLIGGLGYHQYIPYKTINSSPWGSSELNTLETLLAECKDIVDSGDYTLNYGYAGTELYADNNALL